MAPSRPARVIATTLAGGSGLAICQAQLNGSPELALEVINPLIA
jgi:hypothetical protein